MSDDFFEAVARRKARRWPGDASMFEPAAWERFVKARRADWHDYLAELEARGFKVAPVRPTKEMVRAGDEVEDALDCGTFWAAMIAAAPPAPGSEQ